MPLPRWSGGSGKPSQGQPVHQQTSGPPTVIAVALPPLPGPRHSTRPAPWLLLLHAEPCHSGMTERRPARPGSPQHDDNAAGARCAPTYLAQLLLPQHDLVPQARDDLILRGQLLGHCTRTAPGTAQHGHDHHKITNSTTELSWTHMPARCARTHARPGWMRADGAPCPPPPPLRRRGGQDNRQACVFKQGARRSRVVGLLHRPTLRCCSATRTNITTAASSTQPCKRYSMAAPRRSRPHAVASCVCSAPRTMNSQGREAKRQVAVGGGDRGRSSCQAPLHRLQQAGGLGTRPSTYGSAQGSAQVHGVDTLGKARQRTPRWRPAAAPSALSCCCFAVAAGTAGSVTGRERFRSEKLSIGGDGSHGGQQRRRLPQAMRRWREGARRAGCLGQGWMLCCTRGTIVQGSGRCTPFEEVRHRGSHTDSHTHTRSRGDS